MTQPNRGNEIFRFGPMHFDIDWVKAHIAAGSAKFIVENYNIVEWAEKILLLDRARPEYQPHALMMRIDYSHLDVIDDNRLRDPIFMVETDMGLLVIDGNHRIAKAYLKGIDALPSIRFDKAETKKLLKAPKQKRLL